jgi:poly-gamma-glutamate synthesis protein (capsule biosynthesis protein)
MRKRHAGRLGCGILLFTLLAGACEPGASRPPNAGTSADPTPSGSLASVHPVAFVVHWTRPPIDLTPQRAEDLLDGRVSGWDALGEPAAPVRIIVGAGAAVAATRSIVSPPSDGDAVRAVERDRNALAVVRAEAVEPTVRAVTVAGRHPVRNPGDYPLLVPGPPAGTPVTVIVAGDVMLARRVGQTMARSGDYTAPFRHVAERLAAADLAVVNFESTLSRAGSPTQGADSFAADPKALAGLRSSGVDLVSLGNNHTGDFGPRALVETVSLLRDAGFLTTGAGRGESDARAPAILERGGVRVGLLAFNAIGETPAAGPGRPGAVQVRMQPRTGPLVQADLDKVLEDVRALAGRADAVVVYPHWGGNYTRAVHSDQRKVARALVDAGADLVVGAHPHWTGGLEPRGQGVIAYSLGNFIFDMDFSRETMEGIALQATFWGGRLMAVELLPVRIRDDFAPEFLSWTRGRSILDRVWAVSRGPFTEEP